MVNERTKGWRKSRAKKTRNVSFALGKAEVKLLSSFVYKAGRVYYVKDILTGRTDCVGAEHLTI